MNPAIAPQRPPRPLLTRHTPPVPITAVARPAAHLPRPLALLLAALLGTAGCLGGTEAVGILPGAPKIITQPVAKTVPEGSNASFAVVATGDTLSYQWYRGGNILPGATAATINIAAVRPADAGVYLVVISNRVGTLVSDTASLIVVPGSTTVRGYRLTGGTATSTNQKYEAISSDEPAVTVTSAGDLTMINPTITKTGDASSVTTSLRTGTNATVLASVGTILVVDGTITSTGAGASGLFATGAGSRITMQRGAVTTTGASSYAIGATLGAIVDVSRTKLRATSATTVSASDASTVSILVEGDSISGLLTADATSSINLYLQKGATLNGTLQNVNVTLDSASVWNVTANSAVTVLSVAPARISGTSITNITGNGFTVSYLASRSENAALAGKTYTLVGGGTVVPR